jgi:Matrixin
MSDVPPRPDVVVPRRRGNRMPWIVAAVFAAVAVTAAVLASPSAQPGAAPDAAPSYSFLAETFVDGERVPIRWNPCQPIVYQTNLAAAPPGMAAAIDRAVGQASLASGIPIRSTGSTRRDLRNAVRQGFTVDALRSIYRPVLIDVVSHERFRSLGEPRRVVAFAHPQEGTGDFHNQYVAGYVVIDGGARYAPSGRWSMELIVMHELGHLLGLGHVEAPDELMYSEEVAPRTAPNQISTWGPGDLEGLRLLGAEQGCLEHLRVASGH